MNKTKKIITLSIISLFATTSVFADYAFVEEGDFTGDAFYAPAGVVKPAPAAAKEDKHTVPPIKVLRQKIQQKSMERRAKEMQHAPTLPAETIYSSDKEKSEFASKEVKENFEENMMPDGFEADEQAILEHEEVKKVSNKPKKTKEAVQENTENIVIDCEDMDYDTERYCLIATGNVNVEFVTQQTIVKADKLTYDRMNNTIKAEGNVKILKNGQTIVGDYIFVDMNAENALIENPYTNNATIEMRAQKGYVYGDKIVQENGSIAVDKDYPIEFESANRGPKIYKMITPKSESLTDDMEKGIVKVKAKEIKITQKDNIEILSIRHANVKKNNKTILKVPAIKVYTNKKRDFVETNSWEIGSTRGLGMYVGPGFVFELPKGSVLKAIPILNYDHKIGVGAIGRFQSGTNFTQAGYGTARNKFLIRGKQELDDNLFFQYGIYDYMNEWFLGRRRPKYGADFVYHNSYSSNDFLWKGHSSDFSHRIDLGYYHDIDEDRHFRKLKGKQIGTTRARYMAQGKQTFYNYKNEENQTALNFSIVAQLAASIYGTGDTQFIGRVGPSLHTQYKRWMQDISFYQSVYDDHSPIPVFDAYRYGKSSITLREYFRICRFLTVSWFGSINVSGDSSNNQAFQENSFYVSFGPDDVKFSLGYDFIRDNTFFTVQVMMNAKGTKIDYDKLEIKQDKKAKKQEGNKSSSGNSFQNTNRAPVLQHAVVEDINTVDDVL